MLDNKDKKILDVLKQNARLSIRDVAKKTKLRPSTVHKRLQNLISSGIIKEFTLKLDDSALDQDFTAFVYLSTNQDLPSNFFSNPNLKEAFGITGEYDLLLKYKFKDISQFNDHIISLRKNKAISKTITNIATINLKEVLN